MRTERVVEQALFLQRDGALMVMLAEMGAHQIRAGQTDAILRDIGAKAVI